MCMLDGATFHILSTSRISLRHIYEPGDKVQGVTSTPLAGQLPPTVVIPFGNSSRRGRRLGRRSTQITHFYSTPITSTSICTAITARLRVSHNVFASPPTA